MSQEHNFLFPIPPIANERVKLVPFVPDRHAEAYFTQTAPHPELYSHMPLGPFATKADFVDEILEKMIRSDRGCVAFAIIDKTRPASAEDDEGELAGLVSFLNTSATHLSTELGLIVTPGFHRTHVAGNAVGLMLKFALDGADEGGLGLRRVVWHASEMNSASIRVAERMGFRREGVLRWHFVFVNGVQRKKIGNGRGVPPGCEEGDLGRDTVVLGLCWDDWLQDGRERVEGEMARTK